MIPKKHDKQSTELGDILNLIQDSFSYMDGRINPPSSMHALSVADIADHCSVGEVWSFGDPLTACMFLKPKGDALYVGKLAVSENQRGKGIGRKMINHAVDRAKAQNKPFLELYTRIELTENHLAFSSLGFKKIAEASHPGFAKPTYIIMRKRVE